jgi:hypothetical protein
MLRKAFQIIFFSTAVICLTLSFSLKRNGNNYLQFFRRNKGLSWEVKRMVGRSNFKEVTITLDKEVINGINRERILEAVRLSDYIEYGYNNNCWSFCDSLDGFNKIRVLVDRSSLKVVGASIEPKKNVKIKGVAVSDFYSRECVRMTLEDPEVINFSFDRAVFLKDIDGTWYAVGVRKNEVVSAGFTLEAPRINALNDWVVRKWKEESGFQ